MSIDRGVLKTFLLLQGNAVYDMPSRQKSPVVPNVAFAFSNSRILRSSRLVNLDSAPLGLLIDGGYNRFGGGTDARANKTEDRRLARLQHHCFGVLTVVGKSEKAQTYSLSQTRTNQRTRKFKRLLELVGQPISHGLSIDLRMCQLRFVGAEETFD